MATLRLATRRSAGRSPLTSVREGCRPPGSRSSSPAAPSRRSASLLRITSAQAQSSCWKIRRSPGAVDAFRAAGGRILSVPLHAAGADIELIAATISQSAVRAVYLMPTFHNPAGAVMPEAARRELARLGRASGVPIIEDNTLAELALGCEPPPPLAAYGRDAHIVSIGSLGKLFWAGARVGWVPAPPSPPPPPGQLKAGPDLGR